MHAYKILIVQEAILNLKPQGFVKAGRCTEKEVKEAYKTLSSD